MRKLIKRKGSKKTEPHDNQQTAHNDDQQSEHTESAEELKEAAFRAVTVPLSDENLIPLSPNSTITTLENFYTPSSIAADSGRTNNDLDPRAASSSRVFSPASEFLMTHGATEIPEYEMQEELMRGALPASLSPPNTSHQIHSE